MTREEREERMKKCMSCPHAKEVKVGDSAPLLRCFKEPYTGKWVVEVVECPLEEEK